MISLLRGQYPGCKKGNAGSVWIAETGKRGRL